ncbi:MAG: hypothetical protein ACW98U_08825 [Candidatus Thorarchaeota archaeon]|jgi:tetratricopeptide (TPR) repeat protein
MPLFKKKEKNEERDNGEPRGFLELALAGASQIMRDSVVEVPLDLKAKKKSKFKGKEKPKDYYTWSTEKQAQHDRAERTVLGMADAIEYEKKMRQLRPFWEILYHLLKQSKQELTEDVLKKTINFTKSRLKDAPNEEGGLQVLATCQVYMGESEEAEKTLDSLVKRFPKSAQGWLMLGAIRWGEVRQEECLAALETAHELMPDDEIIKDYYNKMSFNVLMAEKRRGR